MPGDAGDDGLVKRSDAVWGRTPPVGGLIWPEGGRTSPVGGLKWTAPAKGSTGAGTELVGRLAGLAADGGAPIETRAVTGLIDSGDGLAGLAGAGAEPVVDPVAGRGVVGGIWKEPVGALNELVDGFTAPVGGSGPVEGRGAPGGSWKEPVGALNDDVEGLGGTEARGSGPEGRAGGIWKELVAALTGAAGGLATPPVEGNGAVGGRVAPVSGGAELAAGFKGEVGTRNEPGVGGSGVVTGRDGASPVERRSIAVGERVDPDGDFPGTVGALETSTGGRGVPQVDLIGPAAEDPVVGGDKEGVFSEVVCGRT
jgi:hypothetical protein